MVNDLSNARVLDRLIVSQDQSLIDISKLHDYLCNESSWARGIPVETVARSLENSLCIGAYLDDSLVGFCRVITDYATFANLVDVVVWPKYRGLGIAKIILDEVVGHSELKGVRRFTLVTYDAHGLYEKFGFKTPEMPEICMEIFRKDIYSNNA